MPRLHSILSFQCILTLGRVLPNERFWFALGLFLEVCCPSAAQNLWQRKGDWTHGVNNDCVKLNQNGLIIYGTFLSQRSIHRPLHLYRHLLFSKTGCLFFIFLSSGLFDKSPDLYDRVIVSMWMNVDQLSDLVTEILCVVVRYLHFFQCLLFCFSV